MCGGLQRGQRGELSQFENRRGEKGEAFSRRMRRTGASILSKEENRCVVDGRKDLMKEGKRSERRRKGISGTPPVSSIAERLYPRGSVDSSAAVIIRRGRLVELRHPCPGGYLALSISDQLFQAELYLWIITGSSRVLIKQFSQP